MSFTFFLPLCCSLLLDLHDEAEADDPGVALQAVHANDLLVWPNAVSNLAGSLSVSGVVLGDDLSSKVKELEAKDLASIVAGTDTAHLGQVVELNDHLIPVVLVSFLLEGRRGLPVGQAHLD